MHSVKQGDFVACLWGMAWHLVLPTFEPTFEIWREGYWISESPCSLQVLCPSLSSYCSLSSCDQAATSFLFLSCGRSQCITACIVLCFLLLHVISSSSLSHIACFHFYFFSSPQYASAAPFSPLLTSSSILLLEVFLRLLASLTSVLHLKELFCIKKSLWLCNTLQQTWRQAWLFWCL